MGRVSKDRAALKALGRKIAMLRRSRGFTQAQVAQLAGMTIRYVSMIETGRRNPNSPGWNLSGRDISVRNTPAFL